MEAAPQTGQDRRRGAAPPPGRGTRERPGKRCRTGLCPFAWANTKSKCPSVNEPAADLEAIGDDIAAGLRHFPVGRYLILYREIDNRVEIVRYVHGMRRLRGLSDLG
jgi:hypothetical protein